MAETTHPGQAPSKCLPFDLWTQDTLPSLLHHMLSHQPCLPASLTPPSLVYQGSRQAGNTLLLFWAGLLTTSAPPLSPLQNRRRASSMGYQCIPALNLAGVKDWAGSWLCSREAGAAGGREEVPVSLAQVLSHPCWNTLPVSAHAWEHQQVLRCSGRGSRFLGSQSGLLGGRKGHTALLEALALYSAPLSMTKA